MPVLTGPTAEIVGRLGASWRRARTFPAAPTRARLAEVPAAIRAGVAAALDGGELPGTPSTVIDLTGPEPVILRAGAGEPDEALARDRGCAHIILTSSRPMRLRGAE